MAASPIRITPVRPLRSDAVVLEDGEQPDRVFAHLMELRTLADGATTND